MWTGKDGKRRGVVFSLGFESNHHSQPKTNTCVVNMRTDNMAFYFRVLLDRITDQHYLMKDVFGGNYHAPMDLAFKRVFENGCGAGDWSLVSEFSIVFFSSARLYSPRSPGPTPTSYDIHDIRTSHPRGNQKGKKKGAVGSISFISLSLSLSV